MNIEQEIKDWLETWAPNCGAPRKVFVGQFKALMREIYQEVCTRAEVKMNLTHKLEGAHYAALKEVLSIINEIPEK